MRSGFGRHVRGECKKVELVGEPSVGGFFKDVAKACIEALSAENLTVCRKLKLF